MSSSRKRKIGQLSTAPDSNQPLYLIDQENPHAERQPMPSNVKWALGKAIIRLADGKLIEEIVILVEDDKNVIGEAISSQELKERNKKLPFTLEYSHLTTPLVTSADLMLRILVKQGLSGLSGLSGIPIVHELLAHAELKLNVNTRHPLTGRTVLHEAAMGQDCSTSKIFFKTLIDDYQANKDIPDNEGYTPIDLLENPHPFIRELVEYDVRLAQMRNRYAAYFVNKLNSRFTTPKTLKIVKDTRELLHYVDKNDQFNQIGFIVPKPKCIAQQFPHHLSPILFDRKTNVFVQLDSTGVCFSVPDRPDAKFIHSPILRQSSMQGCIEDSIILPYFILTQFPGFFEFCQNKSEKDIEILQPVTADIHLKLSQITTDKEERKLAPLLNRARMQKQMNVLIMHDLKPLTNIYRLTEWPVELVMFLSRYDSLYPLRTKDKLGDPKHDLLLKNLLQKGNKRGPTLKETDLRKNLIMGTGKHDKKYDICGTNMEARSKIWQKAIHQDHLCTQYLFFKKLSLAHIREKQKILDNISDFVGTLDIQKIQP